MSPKRSGKPSKDREPNFAKVRPGLFAMMKKAEDESHRLWASKVAHDLLKAEISWYKHASGKEKQTAKLWESRTSRILLLAADVAEGRSLSKCDAKEVSDIKPHFDLLVEFILNPNQGAVRRGKGRPKKDKVHKEPKLTSKRKIVMNMLEQFPELRNLTPEELLRELKERKVWRDETQEWERAAEAGQMLPERHPHLKDLDIVREAYFAHKSNIKEALRCKTNGKP